MLCVSECAHWEQRKRRNAHTSRRSGFGWCQQLPPSFLSPCNTNISAHLKVSCHTLRSSPKRGQTPFCSWGVAGCWRACRQDRVLVAVMWHGEQPIAHPRCTQGAFARSWLSLGPLQSSSPSLGQPSAPPFQQSSPKVRPASLLKFEKVSSLIRETHLIGSMHYTGS